MRGGLTSHIRTCCATYHQIKTGIHGESGTMKSDKHPLFSPIRGQVSSGRDLGEHWVSMQSRQSRGCVAEAAQESRCRKSG